jgi:hypothetical protein
MRTSRHRVREWYVPVLLIGSAVLWPIAGTATSHGQAAAPPAAEQVAASAPSAQAAAPAQAAPAPAAVATSANGAKTWIGHEAEYEEYLKTAAVVKIEDVPIGVTKPKRAVFDGNGPIRRAAWKPLSPGMHGGFWDSYKSEIAAYELDKMLELNMVPPAVEREIKGDKGAIIQWVEDIKSWKITDPVAGPDQNAWNKQVVAMKMFDNLIGNVDRNQGNLLYDAQYNLILIDHSRAFTDTNNLPMPMTRYWKGLWERMEALTIEDLQAKLGPWVGKGEVKAIIRRRDKMKKEIIDKIAQKEPANVIP